MVAPFKTAKDVLDETTEKLKRVRDAGAVNAEEYARGIRRATDAYKKSGISELNIGDLLKEKLNPFDQLADDKRRQSEALGKGAITTAEYSLGVKNATDKMKAASQMSRYFDTTDTLAGRQAALAEVYANLEKQAKALNMTDKQLDEAKRRRRKIIKSSPKRGGSCEEQVANLLCSREKHGGSTVRKITPISLRGVELAREISDVPASASLPSTSLDLGLHNQIGHGTVPVEHVGRDDEILYDSRNEETIVSVTESGERTEVGNRRCGVEFEQRLDRVAVPPVSPSGAAVFDVMPLRIVEEAVDEHGNGDRISASGLDVVSGSELGPFSHAVLLGLDRTVGTLEAGPARVFRQDGAIALL